MGVFTHWPNRITAIRFGGSLVLFTLFALALDRPEGELVKQRGLVNLAFWLFVVIATTDFLDGYLARKGGHVTAFGRIADPFTDKVLILGTLIFFTATPWSSVFFPASMVVVILARELLVTGLRGYVESRGGEFPADRFGKIKMIVQCCAVGGVFWVHAWAWPAQWLSFWVGLTHFLVWATLVATVGSGIGYVRKTARILEELDG
ncbi:MAG: CDP-diacylglycerol--glycerol-3-phosphate 3-phosphatidyltransferase [Planctomycetota bacterium]|nr:CDP-diacylglycerol--glycerol-3-phosphate 3-phosphatidyltransferase [Planctomycetota bacterium]